MQRAFLLAVLVSCVSLSPGLLAQEPTPEHKDNTSETLNAEASKALYDQHCKQCHSGLVLYVPTGPILLSLEWTPEKLDQARTIIHKGTQDGGGWSGMPAFGDKLSEAEIESILVYLRDNATPDDPNAPSHLH